MLQLLRALLALTLCASAAATGAASGRDCVTAAGCSLNGLCTAGKCVCDKPWTGSSCGIMGYASTPASGKDVYNVSDPANTWNGPIVGPEEGGLYHIYVPLYKAGSLGGAKVCRHGTAAHPAGPYTWGRLPDIECAINPAFVVYTNASSGKKVYSLWTGGKVQVASTADGPFSYVDGFEYGSVGGNPAPIYHDGAFYLTTQHTKAVWTTPSLAPGSKWSLFANVSFSNVPAGARPEDPYMWIDKRGNWHIINHAYDTKQKTQCGNSTLSTHFYSADGKAWACGERNPYGHSVKFDDGTSHTYTTLERPNIHFNSKGQMDYLSLAADLITGDEGCAPTPCTNCKYGDHAGTLVVALDM